MHNGGSKSFMKHGVEDQMKELADKASEEGSSMYSTGHDDIFTQVMGPDSRGRKRCFGRATFPGELSNTTSNRDNADVRSLKGKVVDVEEDIKSLNGIQANVVAIVDSGRAHVGTRLNGGIPAGGDTSGREEEDGGDFCASAIEPEFIEVELDPSSSSQFDSYEVAAEVISAGIKKLEKVIHRIVVRRSAPDWLPFLPNMQGWSDSTYDTDYFTLWWRGEVVGEVEAATVVHSYKDSVPLGFHKTRLTALNVPPMGLFYRMSLVPDVYPPPPRSWFSDDDDMLEETWDFPRRIDVSDGYFSGSSGYFPMWENYPIFKTKPKKEDNIGLADAIMKRCIDLQRKLFCSMQLIGRVALTEGLVPAAEERVLHAIPSHEAIDTVEVL
ncbi:actin-related protein 9 [Forsythia ovata]|uniref:Actin-related protein 9 n=1 Tax=Forsythia ovata TaxID=205694 RepID=A0ABD1S3F7_9LAMI